MSVHNHPPYRPVCNERMTPHGLRGACLNDDGTPKSQATKDLMGRIHAAVHSADPNVRAEAVARLIDDVTAELRGDVELLTGRVEAAEDSENLIRDTLAKRSAVVNTLAAENERLRAVLANVQAAWNGTQNVNWLRLRIRDRWAVLGSALDATRAALAPVDKQATDGA